MVFVIPADSEKANRRVCALQVQTVSDRLRLSEQTRERASIPQIDKQVRFLVRRSSPDCGDRDGTPPVGLRFPFRYLVGRQYLPAPPVGRYVDSDLLLNALALVIVFVSDQQR